MNNEKHGNKERLIAIILIAVIVLFLVGATAVGAIGNDTKPPEEENKNPETPNDENKPSETPPTDNPSTDIPNDTDSNTKPQDKVTYINYISGLEISEEIYASRPYAVIFDSSSAQYGLSLSDLCIEVPTEGGQTRYLAYISKLSSESKLGALAPCRAYISSLCDYFGGIIVSDGTDDAVKYTQNSPRVDIDLSNTQYSFIENISSKYTSAMLINKYIADFGVDSLAIKKPPMPFIHSDTPTMGKISASSLTLPYSKDSGTRLVYNKETEKYILYKQDRAVIDMQNGCAVSFTNCFVCFTDTTTYEKATGIEMVTETRGSGSGYYLYGEKLCEIRWQTDAGGNLKFYDLNGNILNVSAGNNYIGYFKASEASLVKYE